MNHPDNERFAQMIAGLHNRVRALETQQQVTLSGSNGQPVINLGLTPGVTPAQYGLQIVDPTTGNQVAFLGEDSTGTTQLNVAGTLYVSGNTVIGGNLSVPNGSITNAALNAPVYPVAVGSSATNFSVPAIALHTVCTINVPVPSGYSQALVHMNVDLGVWNSTTSTTFFAHAACYPGAATAGLDNVVSVPPNTAGAVSDSAQALLTGLTSGGNVQLEGQAFTDSGTIPASTSTGMNVAAIVLFLR